MQMVGATNEIQAVSQEPAAKSLSSESDEGLFQELRAEVMASHKILHDTVFIIRFQGKFVMKRFEDFVDLDQALRKLRSQANWGHSEAVVSFVPDLPGNGRFGIRSSLSSIGIGSFNEERVEGLQMYLDAVLMQVDTLEDVLPLSRFFSEPITDKTRQHWGKLHTEQQHENGAKVKKSQSRTRQARPESRPVHRMNVAIMMGCHFQSLRGQGQSQGGVAKGGAQGTAKEAAKVDFQVGDRAVLDGLCHKVEFNNLEVTVVECSHAAGQYRVLLEDGRCKRVCDFNLRGVPAACAGEAWDATWAKVSADEGKREAYKESAVKGWTRLALLAST